MYSAKASASSTLSDAEILSTAARGRSVGVSRSGEILSDLALLTMHLPVRTQTCQRRISRPWTLAGGPSNAHIGLRFHDRSPCFAGSTHDGRLDRLLRF